jgi:hypothetical protein
MLKIVRQRLDVEFEGQQAFEFQKQVDESLNPLINGVRREYFKRLGLRETEVEEWLLREHKQSSSPLLLGDLVLRDADTVAYYRMPRTENVFEAGVITRNDPAEYKDFFDQLLAIARKTTRRKDLSWTSEGPDAELSTTLASDSVVVVPTAKEVEAARELENDQAQRLIGQIMEAGSVFLTRFSQQLQQDRAVTDRHIQRFEELSVVSKDFAVLCRKTGQQILRVSSRAAIEDPSQKTFKCFICGNSVSEELLDEIITVTDFGRKLLERDYWLVVRVLGALEAAGVPNEKVHIHAGEGDLTNFFVTINDQLYMIVVANRKITLEESYLINAHVAAYKLTNVVVVSTERVSMLMRHHLEKSNPEAEFDFLDSLRTLEDRLTAIFARKEKSVLKKVLENFGALTPVHVQDVVMQRISPEAAPAPVPAAPPPPPDPEPEKPTRGKNNNKTAKEEAAAPPPPPPAPEPPAPHEEEVPDTEFPMMGEVLEVDESMMTEAPPG